MTTPQGRTPHSEDPAEGPDISVEGRRDSDVEPHPDSRGMHSEDPAEGPVSIPGPRST